MRKEVEKKESGERNQIQVESRKKADCGSYYI